MSLIFNIMATVTDKIKVWPEMVLRETLAAIIATILLLLASMYIDAPLEAIADPSASTNPSKAPWYFLGLQELLVYFPPWIAGVLIPMAIMTGLCAIPYIDTRSQSGSGDRQYALEKDIRYVFTGGLTLWVVLTLIGVFMRGPNWRLQWPDGTPLGANAPVMPMDWLMPAIVSLYVLSVMARKRKREDIRRVGLLRLLLSHLMVLCGLIISVKIALFTVLAF